MNMAENTAAVQGEAPSSNDTSKENAPPNSQDSSSFDWRSSNHSLKQRFEFIFNNKLYCDVNFIVGQEHKQKIPACKFILSAGSLVFHTMFNGKWQNSDVVEVPDIEPAVFRELLRFLHSDEVSITDDTAFGLIYAAKKYGVFGLENQCTEYISKHVCSSNAFYFLMQARFFDAPSLISSCLDVIDSHTAEALCTDGFCTIDNETLCLVLARDSLNINEMTLFEAVVRWARAECKRKNLPENPESQKSVLQGALSLIRYPVMLPEDFADKVVDAGLLSEEEQLSLSLYFIKKSKHEINFNINPRRPMYLILNRFEGVKSGLKCDGSTQTLRFYVKQFVQLVGIGLFGPVTEVAEYAVHFSVSVVDWENKDLESIVYEHSETRVPAINSIRNVSSVKIFRIFFTEPVDLNPNLDYVIKFSMKGPDCVYGVSGRKTFSQKGPDGKEVHVIVNETGTSPDFIVQGQIPELLFKV